MNVDVRWRQRFQNLERAVVLLHEPWKTLKDYLEHQGQTLQPVTPRNVVKEAFRLTD